MRIRLDRRDFEFFIVSCWSMWYDRNKIKHENSGYTPLEIVQFVRRFVGFLRSNMYKLVGSGVEEENTVLGPWQVPLAGWINLALRMGFEKIILEGDSLNVIKGLQSSEQVRSACSDVCREIQNLFPSFAEVKTSHVSREANSLADRLCHDFAIDAFGYTALPFDFKKSCN